MIVKWLAVVLCSAALPLAAQVRFEGPKDGTITVVIHNKPYTTFYFGPDTTKPYLHPLRAASGTIITRLYPMEEVPGESRDHKHHRGLWFGHGDVNGTTFWDNEASYKNPNRGRIVFDNFMNTSSKGNAGTLNMHFVWDDPSGKPLLKENRYMTFYDDPTRRIIDLDITLEAVQPVTFGDTKEGTFAIRLAHALAEQHGGVMTNAEGAQHMANVWGKPSKWVDYAGEIKGEKIGIAIFDNPENPRYPARWHSRDYGLFAVNIFALKDFTGDKTADGSMKLEAGQKIRFRYRVLIHPGGTDRTAIEKEFKKYAGGS